MHGQSAWNMYIFRSGRTQKNSAELIRELAESFKKLSSGAVVHTQLLDALLRAGELECALADLDSPFSTLLKNMTEALALALVRSEAGDHTGTPEPAGILRDLQKVQMPPAVLLSPPEGFAYYALHPMSYVDAIRGLKSKPCQAAVIGIRSIGTTLSAVVQAALASVGLNAERITVRPTGHPYNRTTKLARAQRKWVEKQRVRGAHFFVVDEGPGMSGSSFLSVGDALVKAGVDRSLITFIGSRIPDPTTLTARGGGARWTSFRTICVAPNRRLPAGATQFIAGGIWRGRVFGDEGNWPASWTQMERLKFLSDDERRLFKFEGFGRFGEEVHSRAQAVGQAKFGPLPIDAEEGFSIYPVVKGEPLLAADLSAQVTSRIGSYCAMRARELTADAASSTELEKMLRFNFREEFGVDGAQHALEIVRPVIADGRMLPHKWLRTNTGELLKVDNASHGDDHFFPGPTDVAWDLAGAIVEWGMDDSAAENLLARYQSESGDDARRRLPAYLLAYSIFRMGYCKMAAEAMRGTSEQSRLESAYLNYRQIAWRAHERTSVHREVLRLIPKKGQVPELPIKQLA